MPPQIVSATTAAKPAASPAIITDGSIPGTSSKLVNMPPRRRLIVSISGKPKEGKTHFSLTAPGPIAIQNIDDGLEGVAEKFISDKEIHEAKYAIGLPMKQSECQKVYDQLINDYKAFLGSSHIRTIVHDTSTELWEIIRMNRLGKLAQVLPHNYAPANADFREMIRLAYQSDANLILLGKSKKEYINEQFSGKYIRAGFSDLEFLVQVVGDMSKLSDGRFKLTVKSCRQNTSLEGKDFVGDDCNFLSLAKAVYPSSTTEEWLRGSV